MKLLLHISVLVFDVNCVQHQGQIRPALFHLRLKLCSGRYGVPTGLAMDDSETDNRKKKDRLVVS